MDNDRDMIETVAKWLGVGLIPWISPSSGDTYFVECVGNDVATRTEANHWFLVSGCEKAIIDKLTDQDLFVVIDVRRCGVSAELIRNNGDVFMEFAQGYGCPTIAAALTRAVYEAIKAGKIEVQNA